MADLRRSEAVPPATPTRNGKMTRWLTYSPVPVAALLMVPRLASAQFGMFDDAHALVTVRRILWGEWSLLQVPWEVAAGRLRPTYWLFHIALDLLVGKSPFGYYVANTCLLSATVGGLIWLVRLAGGSRLRAALSGLLFAVAGPAVESYYTLSKGEPLQAVCLIGSVVGIVMSGRARSRLGRFGWWLGALLALLLAFGSKETAIAILPVSAGWLAVGVWRSLASKDRQGLAARTVYFAAGLAASVIFFGLATSLRGTGFMQGGYSVGYALDRSTLIAVMIRWSGWLMRDFAYLLPLGLVVTAMWLARRIGSMARSLIDSLIWMSVWVVVFLPWARFTVEYYMLPFAIGAAAFGAAATELALRSISSASRGWRVLGLAGLALSGVLWLLTLPTNWSNARVQLAVDSANADVVRFIATHAPSQSQVLINIQDPNEYVMEFGVHLSEIYGRRDLVAVPIQLSDPGLGALGDGPTFLVVPEVQNTPKLSVRMGVIDETQRFWNDELMATVHGRSAEVFETMRAFRLATFDSPRLVCRFFPRTSYCSGPSPLFDARMFSYGWRVYRLD